MADIQDGYGSSGILDFADNSAIADPNSPAITPRKFSATDWTGGFGEI